MAKKIIFICLGNICRSPLAQGIARDYARKKGYHFIIDSAGISNYHRGEMPHQDSMRVARENNLDISDLRSSQISAYTQADFFIAMDQSNVESLIALGIQKSKIYKIGNFGLDGIDIPDPYDYKGLDGFYEVFSLLNKGVKQCLDELWIREKFSQDMITLYEKIESIDHEIFKFYEVLQNKDHFFYQILIEFCKENNLPQKNTLLLALADRIIQLKEGPILQELKNLNLDSGRIDCIKTKLFDLVESFYNQRHQQILDFIETKKLLSSFYRVLLQGVCNIGKEVNLFAKAWQKALFMDLYPKLEKQKTQDEILAMFQSTIDQEEGVISDRSYSIPVEVQDSFIILPYSKAFKAETKAIIYQIEILVKELVKHVDVIFHQEEQYLQYLAALKDAFANEDLATLIKQWQKVDSQWMQITTPIQIGHFFEYYEDKYRHCVAPEWDIRLAKTDRVNLLESWIENCLDYFSKKIDASKTLIDFSKNALKNVSIFYAIPAFFYGSNLNGLFSAQVVPNDEKITKIYGKKIFAFPDRILQIVRSRPKMKLSYLTFGRKIMQEYYDILYHQEELWHQIYDISTNGHEYGHILWMEENTQILMNRSGMFKNIEEFKATSGGLCAFFLNHQDQLLCRQVLLDHLIRAVGLIAWREQEDVLPYYYEGLIHLHGAFLSGAIDFAEERKVKLQIYPEKFEKFKQWYLEIYEKLAEHYKEKKDAKEFLEQFVRHKTPLLKDCAKFVEWYFLQYQKIGREIDDEII